MLTSGFEKAREQLRTRAFGLIRAFRSSGYHSLRFNSAQEQATAQQAIASAASSMEVLALCTLGALKCAGLREGAELRTDVRAAALADLITMVCAVV